jgi:putative phosphoesterase
MTTGRFVVGLIADTHGLLRPEATQAMRGSNHIIHAGDVGAPGLLDTLAGIAPLSAVRGNIDTAPWAETLPMSMTVDIGGVTIHVVHDKADLARYPAPAGCQVVVYGHSHRPETLQADGMLLVNPGSAGPRRFSLPISAARLIVEDGKPSVTIVTLIS